MVIKSITIITIICNFFINNISAQRQRNEWRLLAAPYYLQFGVSKSIPIGNHSVQILLPMTQSPARNRPPNSYTKYWYMGLNFLDHHYTPTILYDFYLKSIIPESIISAGIGLDIANIKYFYANNVSARYYNDLSKNYIVKQKTYYQLGLVINYQYRKYKVGKLAIAPYANMFLSRNYSLGSVGISLIY